MSDPKNLCPECTFDTHPYMHSCEICKSFLLNVRLPWNSESDGRYALADYYGCNPAQVTLASLRNTTYAEAGWDKMADRIKADLTSTRRSESARFTGTFAEWKSHLSAEHTRTLPDYALPGSREITALEVEKQDTYHESTGATLCNDQDIKQLFWLSKCRGGNMGGKHYNEQQCKDRVELERAKEREFGRAADKSSWTVYTHRD